MTETKQSKRDAGSIIGCFSSSFFYDPKHPPPEQTNTHKAEQGPAGSSMDVLASYSIFQELQLVHDTGYFSALPSLEENWQQVNALRYSCKSLKRRQSVPRGCASAFISFFCSLIQGWLFSFCFSLFFSLFFSFFFLFFFRVGRAVRLSLFATAS